MTDMAGSSPVTSEILDLFITSTDLDGVLSQLEDVLGTRIETKEYGTVFHFRKRPGEYPFARLNETAYEKSTSIKASSLALMDKAQEPYSKYSKNVEEILLEAQKAYEYAKERPKNEESTKQWKIMIDPERNMLAGFFKRWKSEKKLRKSFIDEAKGQIGKGFDQISGLESGKIKKK